MSNSKLLIYSVFFSFFISFASSSYLNTTTHKCSAQQTLALLLFKQNLSSINFSFDYYYIPNYDPCEDWLGSEGYYPIMMNWNTSIDCCDWDGVTCDHSTGDVISLDLSCGMLKGTLHPNTSLFNLPHLQRLNLAFNDFIGSQIPREIARFSNTLTHLNISECLFTGQVPTDITLLHKLVSLDLSRNKDDFSLEPRVFINMLQNYTTLEELSLRNVNISSVLPAHLNISSSLKLLNLQHTGLQGNLPHNILKLQSLEILDLSFNRFTGQIPWEISLLPKLVSIHLSENVDLRIKPHIFSSLLQNSTLLRNLGVTGVNIGFLPIYLTISSSSLKTLDLSGTGLQGTLPHNIFNLQYLEGLNLSGNNNLTGPLPKVNTSTSIHPLKYLDLSYTNLSGEIPYSIGHLKSLTYLDLTNCNLMGSLTKSLVNLRNLTVLYLSSNKLNGTLPSWLYSLQSLEGLILNGNQLEGEVPSSLSKCQSLKVIDLGNNHLNGTFPHWLGSLPNLQVLVLKSNSFHGPIVPSFTVGFPFQSLQVFDLSYNGFVGQLPQRYFQNFNAMKNSVKRSTEPEYLSIDEFYSFVFTVKGVEQDFLQLYVYNTIICLSHNNFDREIPDIIGNLNSLKVLDLSHSSLTGQIPHALGKLSEIESLDLSCNQLTGKIPQSLADLMFLGYLNLSQNHLMGHIPNENQFQTFDSCSFVGNPKLCGFPLSKNCKENPLEPQLEGDGDGDEEESGFTWRVVMLGYGCGTLLGLVMGYLMLSTGRPMWFNAIADAGEQMILKRRNKRRYIYIGR